MIIYLLATALVIEAVQGASNGLFLPVPQLQDVRGDSKSRTIRVLWTDGPSITGKLQQVTYDIEVYYTEQKEAVHRDSVEKRPNLTVTHDWHWVSPLPLECLQHSVKLRVRHHSNVSSTSEWTELRHVIGSGSNHSEFAIYPKDDTALVGSKKKFCCIVPERNTFQTFKYRHILMSTNYTRVGRTYIFEVTLEPSQSWGERLTCKTNNNASHTYLFVGYSPEIHNFTCMTRNLSLLECSWIQGNDKNLKGDRGTKYTLNGSLCQQQKCHIKLTADQQQQVTLTLTAKNFINKTSFTYTFNPRHRVYLESPRDLQVEDVNSKNASLKWEQWRHANLMELPMRCQVEMKCNRKREVRNETGIGLGNVILHDLHPYTSYSVRVRCASAEHFWKWGDWSEEITFQTKEDIPQAVDLWMAVDNNNRSFVIWKNLLAEQSHGELTHYQVLWGGSVSNLEPSKSCIDMNEEGVGKMITVTASNSIGHSPPSTLKIPFSPDDMETTRVNSSDGSLQLTWTPSLRASCGYVVDWYPVGRQNMCDIDWIKMPAGHTNVSLKSVFEVGVRYTLSLYACTSHAPELLHRWEGYGQELAPDTVPMNFHGEQHGMDVLLTWDEIPPEQQRGFIRGYKITYFRSSLDNIRQHKTEIITGSQKRMQTKIQNLLPGTYEFHISAFTSGGSGTTTKTTVTLASQTLQKMVHSIISVGFVIMLAAFFAIVCYRKRTWLKTMLYPDIPVPQLDCHTSKGIYDFQLLEIPKENVEYMKACELVAEDQEDHVTESGCKGLYRNVTGSDANLTHCNVVSSSDSGIVVLNNLSYSPLAACPESHCATPVTPTDATQEHQPMVSSACSPLLPSSDSYQAQYGSQPWSNGGNLSESDDCDGLLTKSKSTSVGPSQLLLGDQFRHIDNMHSQLAPCSDSYQAVEDVM